MKYYIIVISSFIFIVCEVGVIIEVVIDALHNRRKKREEKNAQYKDYNKLLEQIVEQEQAICRQAEHDIGQGKIRSEGIAQGLYVAARMIKRFYEEDISEANTRG